MEIIYGSEPPRISFTSSPNGKIDFEIQNRNFVQTYDSDEDISWINLDRGELVYIAQSLGTIGSAATEEFVSIINEKFTGLVNTEAEKKFLKLYIELCISDLSLQFSAYDSLALYPALIPQVWVNWIHYDRKDTQRAERAQREPFRVDFLIKGKYINRSPLIIEIDGASHFGAYASDPSKAMLIYTEHLRKDRWLRKQGWNVVRISNYEIECCQTLGDFQALFLELTGWAMGDLSFLMG
jgi:hypothetical protein